MGLTIHVLTLNMLVVQGVRGRWVKLRLFICSSALFIVKKQWLPLMMIINKIRLLLERGGELLDDEIRKVDGRGGNMRGRDKQKQEDRKEDFETSTCCWKAKKRMKRLREGYGECGRVLG